MSTKYKLTRATSSLSPSLIAPIKPETAKKVFSSHVEILHQDDHISSIATDKGTKQYSSLISNKNFQNEVQKYDIINYRVAEFYEGFLDSPTYVDLKYIVHFVTILSHGNTRVESGFSINADLLQVEAIQCAGGHTKVEITNNQGHGKICT